MPQVFGTVGQALMAMATLWVQADFLEDVAQHEGALAGAGFQQDNLPVNLDRQGFNARGQVWGQHLRTDGTHHYWAVARVSNPLTNPNARDVSVGGSPRYSVEIHAVPKKEGGRGVVTPLWHGNNINHFLDGTQRSVDDKGKTWPEVQSAMQRGPKK